MMFNRKTLVVLAMVSLFNFAIAATVARASVIFGDLTSGTETTFDINATSADLVNAGAATLASSSLAPTAIAAWPPAGINDGAASTTTTTDNSIYINGSGSFPAVSTFNLDTTIFPLGYRISSIVSIAGWNHPSNTYPNQNITVDYSVVGSAAFTTLFSNHELLNGTATGSTMVTVTDTTGVLATGVDAIRVTYINPTVGNGFTMIREFDVFGVGIVPEPSTFTLLALGLVGLGLRRRRRN